MSVSYPFILFLKLKYKRFSFVTTNCEFVGHEHSNQIKRQGTEILRLLMNASRVWVVRYEWHTLCFGANLYCHSNKGGYFTDDCFLTSRHVSPWSLDLHHCHQTVFTVVLDLFIFPIVLQARALNVLDRRRWGIFMKINYFS